MQILEREIEGFRLWNWFFAPVNGSYCRVTWWTWAIFFLVHDHQAKYHLEEWYAGWKRK